MLLKASCHCQVVKFEVESHTPYPFLRCFCSICRKTAGEGDLQSISCMFKQCQNLKEFYMDL